jgi:hypothetical protein
LWYFFYSPDNTIKYSLHSNRHWGNPLTVINNVTPNFSINLTDKNEIYIFCQDIYGNILLCQYKDKAWSSKIILENKSSEISNINFEMLINNQNLNLVCSVPIPDEKSSKLVYYSKNNNNHWDYPQTVDKITPFTKSPFIHQQINNALSIFFYQKKENGYSLGYREFSSTLKKWGEFNSFHNSAYSYIDQSFLTTDDTIHVLYIVRGKFSQQLIYKQKNGSNWSSPIVLYENQKIELCSLLILDKQLWAIWYINSRIYTCISQNLGLSFGKPSRYSDNSIPLPTKSTFISNKKQKEEHLYIREILLYDEPIPEILLIPELCPDFYRINSSIEIIHKQSVANEDLSKQQINILENKISSYENQIKEKDSQINSFVKERLLLYKTKEILESKIAEQSLELISMQKQLEALSQDTKVQEIVIEDTTLDVLDTPETPTETT